jgi:hypothetical protein
MASPQYDALVYGCAHEINNRNGDAKSVWRERPPSMTAFEANRIHFLAVKVWASAKATTEAAIIRAQTRLKSDRRHRGTEPA